jgi:hypothetical protein
MHISKVITGANLLCAFCFLYFVCDKYVQIILDLYG